jgi:hypothetical protein
MAADHASSRICEHTRQLPARDLARVSTGVNGGRDLEDALHDDDNDPASPLPCRHDRVVPPANAAFLDQRLPATAW